MRASERIMYSVISDDIKYDVEKILSEKITALNEDLLLKASSNKALKALDEIQASLCRYTKNDSVSYFDTVEEIVCILERYDIDCGGCHDLG